MPEKFVSLQEIELARIELDPLFRRMEYRLALKHSIAQRIPYSVVAHSSDAHCTLIHGYLPISSLKDSPNVKILCNVYESCSPAEQIELGTVLWNRVNMNDYDRAIIALRLRRMHETDDVIAQFIRRGVSTVKTYIRDAKELGEDAMAEGEKRNIPFRKWALVQRLAKRIPHISIDDFLQIYQIHHLSGTRLSALVKFVDLASFLALSTDKQTKTLGEAISIMHVSNCSFQDLAESFGFWQPSMIELEVRFDNALHEAEVQLRKLTPSMMSSDFRVEAITRVSEMHDFLEHHQ